MQQIQTLDKLILENFKTTHHFKMNLSINYFIQWKSIKQKRKSRKIYCVKNYLLLVIQDEDDKNTKNCKKSSPKALFIFLTNIYNYFNLHVCLSLRHPVLFRPLPSHRCPVPIPIFRVPDAQSEGFCARRSQAACNQF